MERFAVIASMIIIFLFAYIAVMWLYFYWRRNRPYQKYLPEITIVCGTLLLSFVFKAIILGYSNDGVGDVFKPAYLILRAAYDSLGGLQFEGLAFGLDDIQRINNETVKVALYSVYVGTTLFSAIVFFSVIAAKASYEVYSVLRLVASRLFSTSSDTFIFTGLTKETVILAKSIKAQDKNARIVFTGEDILAFDRHDELCREVMSNGFLYLSGNGNHQDSIAKRLHLNVNNSKGRFVIFAFVAKEHIPAEETNKDIVVSDVRATIRELNLPINNAQINANDYLKIEYFVLTKRNINYQAYQKMIESLQQEYLNQYYSKELPEEEAKGLAKELSKIISLNVWNEANAIADSMARFLKTYRDQEVCFAIPNTKSTYVWSLGFGQTAQALSKELYVQSASIDEEGCASEFLVDAFDTEVDNIGGILDYEEPMSIYLNSEVFYDVEESEGELGEEKKKLKNDLETEKNKLLDRYSKIHFAIVKEKQEEETEKIQKEKDNAEVIKEAKVEEKREYEEEVRAEWEKEFQPFVANLHQISCLDSKFLSRADGYTGISKCVKNPPQYIVVATGDDYRNIRLVNALVYDILSETNGGNSAITSASEHQQPKIKTQVIFVNVWDEKNNDLINLYDLGKRQNSEQSDYQVIKYSQSLFVVILGNNDKIYSSDGVITYTDYAKYHKVYTQANKDDDNRFFDVEKALRNLQESKDSEKYKNFNYIDFENLLKSITDELSAGIVNATTKDVEAEWFKLDIWKKKSNVSVYNYAKTYALYLAKIDDTTPNEKRIEIYLRLMTLEHQRWMRQHIVYGWNLGKSKIDARRIHDCLCPYRYVSCKSLRYDLLNVNLSNLMQQE